MAAFEGSDIQKLRTEMCLKIFFFFFCADLA